MRKPSLIHQGCDFKVSKFFSIESILNIPDEGVDLDGLDIVKLLERLLDLSLVGLDVDNEDKGVVLLNLLHGTLSVERVDNDLVLIETGSMGNGLSWVLWCTGELKGLGSVEGSREADLADLVGVHLSRISNDIKFSMHQLLTPFKAALAAALACLLPLPLVAAPVKLTHQHSLLKNSQYLLLLCASSTSSMFRASRLSSRRRNHDCEKL